MSALSTQAAENLTKSLRIAAAKLNTEELANKLFAITYEPRRYNHLDVKATIQEAAIRLRHERTTL